MKKILYIALAFATVLLGNSCQRNMAVYEYDKDCAGAFFLTSSQKFSMVKEDGNKIIVEMMRGNTKGDMSVPFEMTDYTEGVFVPAGKTFDFKDGENIATLAFNYPDIEDFLAEIYTFDLTIATAQASFTGNNTVTVSAQRQLTFNKVCDVTITDGVWSDDPWDCELGNTVESTTYFTIPDMYVKGAEVGFFAENGVFTLLNPLIDLGQDAGYGYGNYCFMVKTVSYDKTEKNLVFDGYLTMADYSSYEFCNQTAYIALPADFDAEKYFGIE